MDDTWYKIPWRVFCIGKLGTEFYNRYRDKLGVSYALRVFEGKTDYVWSSNVVGASEYGVTVAVYRKLVEE